MADTDPRGAALSGVALSRTLCALVLLFALRGRAQAQGGDFDQALAAQVFTAAFTFMAPRTLQPVAVPQMTGWGLRGITALDPTLVPLMDKHAVVLALDGRPIARMVLPPSDDVAAWGLLVAAVNAAAVANSEALRRAGTQGLITSFFDEVFNHLDPYSRYIPPDAAAAEESYRRGDAGIGVTLARKGGAVVIDDLVAQGPADAAGLRAGARILAVDGTDCRHADPEAVLALLNGDAGSTVAVRLRDPGGRARSVSLTRADVPADTVAAGIDGDALILRVSGFTASTAARLQAELAKGLAAMPQPRGIVLDLRGNRGGVLDQAAESADVFLTNGLIATAEGRDPEADHRWTASGTDDAAGLPIVVLVDGRSASAAEMLTASLEDNGRAVVVGSATLGKGLVQKVGTMPDGGELFVTWSRLLAPAGWPLQELGAMPEVCTSLGQANTDAQLAALNMGTKPNKQALDLHRAARPGIPLAEVLTIRDACPAALGTDTDFAAAHFLIDNPIAYASALAPLRASPL